METQDSAVIAEEVRQLCSQYLQEVPSRRRVWPKSIKDRIFQLLKLEVSSAAIAAQTGIPIATIYQWKSVSPRLQAPSPAADFLPVKVVPNKVTKPQVSPEPSKKPEPRRRYRGKRSAAPTIIVVAPNGIRFEGLDISAALQIAAKLGLGS